MYVLNYFMTFVCEYCVDNPQMFEVFLSQDSDRMAPTDKGIMQEPISDAHYIIHIASCQPDTSQYPLWNQTSDFDNLSWKTLPEELTKVRDYPYL